MKTEDDGRMRVFSSGAVRDTSDNKLDYEACLSPLVLKRYAEYVKSCRVQPDGNIRADDNWQKGFSLSVWMKSKWRHFMTTWRWYRNQDASIDIEVSLCAEFFNTHGMLHEILKSKGTESITVTEASKKRLKAPESCPVHVYYDPNCDHCIDGGVPHD